MPRGYERVDSGDAKDEHGVPMYPVLPRAAAVHDDEPGAQAVAAVAPPSPSAPEAETVIRVTVNTGGAGAAAVGSGPAPLYYGESQALLTPVSHNQIIERDDGTVTVVAPNAAPVTLLAPAPAPAPVTVGGMAVAMPVVAQYAPQRMGGPAGAVMVAAPNAPVPAVIAMPVAEPLERVIPPEPQSVEELDTLLRARRVDFDLCRYFREGRALLKQNRAVLYGLSFVLSAVAVLSFVGALWLWLVFLWRAEAWPLLLIITLFVFGLHRFLIVGPFTIGALNAVMEAVRNNAFVKARDYFVAYGCPYLFRLAGLIIVMSLSGGLLGLLFWPIGLVFAALSAFVWPLHLQFRHIKLGPLSALRLSFRVIGSNFCRFFLFVLLCSLILAAGQLGTFWALSSGMMWYVRGGWVLFLFLVVLGLTLTLPIVVAASVYCYHHLVGINGAAVMVPASTAQFYREFVAARVAGAAAVAAAGQNVQVVIAPAALPQPVQALPVALPVAMPVDEPRVVVVVRPVA